jgi:hypothetical protein
MAKKDITWRILDRGWTFDCVLSSCQHCKRVTELGAGAHHTRWWLGNQLEGYARGLHGLKHNSYEHVSAVSVPLDTIPVWSEAAKLEPDHKKTHGRTRNAEERVCETCLRRLSQWQIDEGIA